MARASKKDQILDKGMQAVRRTGLVGSSVRDITAAAEVPLGSFGNHFASKEQFGLAVIDRYFADVRTVIAATLDDTSRPPLARLRAYFDAITDRLADRGWHDGCLIGNTSIDSTETSEAIRGHLSEVFAEWHEPFARCLAAAQRDGDIELPMAANDFADFLMASWQGAMLRMKVERSPEPLERFKTVVFGTLLAPRA
ncbi:TetR family transcriptional regulator C-terminal domain-containing protein [Yinghuangia soli]|uniref:TetR family transcriptional regulator C-terminal domain-containing protein n=1 Tax=Yinghuangia soli TaxID=2908204 RepID=A0AA41Q283_9ACTN|nr:TetR family transcriptional regulator C-terminal domain-containing protein [Yinghuangia soli]MCF2530209.1 TetR family transcriptional regulator C-terminal domain-containing protein [Yinghuangia soli]